MSEFKLDGKGLHGGDYDFIIDNLKGEGSYIDIGKNIPIRISLTKNTTWEEILKNLPKGSLIKNIRRIR